MKHLYASYLFSFFSLFLLAHLPAQDYTVNWGGVGFVEDVNIPVEVDTYVDPVNWDANPYHGFETASGGITNWLHQAFGNVANSGISIDLYFSRNSTDNILQGPSLYGGLAGPNPDCKVTGDYALRFNNDKTGTITPVTVVVNFSAPVILQEFIVGSLSRIGGTSYENTLVRAFTGENGTGSTVGASTYQNISDLSTDANLLHGQGNASCTNQVYDLANVNMGAVSPNNTYHVVGVGAQNSSRYGRVKWAWNTPIRSIAMSTWITNTSNLNDHNYQSGYHSILIAPISFSPATNFPVEWLDVGAKWENEQAVISWTTIRETNNAYFEVERSADGQEFMSLDQVSAVGNSVQEERYTFLDQAAGTLPHQKLYYRIRQVDVDGQSSYSPTVELSQDESGFQVQTYPNPAQGQTQLHLQQISSEAVSLEIISLDGRRQFSKHFAPGSGSLVYPLSVKEWAPGLYILHWQSEHKSLSQRLWVY